MPPEGPNPDTLQPFLSPEDLAAKRQDILASCETHTAGLGSVEVAGNPLRETQAMAALGFEAWIKRGLEESDLRGRIILPMGSGKTLLAVLLANMAMGDDGQVLFFTWNNSLGRKTLAEFRAHEATKSPADRKTAGTCFGGVVQTDADFIVGNFESSGNWIGRLPNPEKIKLIILDEADVNAMSDRRTGLIHFLAQQWGIPVVAMSATERQASGKELEQAYPDEITRMAMPDSLPRLHELGLIPEIRFEDLYVDIPMAVDAEDLLQRGEIDPKVIKDFLRSPQWTATILDDYCSRFWRGDGFAPGVVVFRDNSLADTIVRQARARGIKASRYTGQEKTDEIQDAFNRGELELLVGSTKIGRGADFPRAKVVYDVTMTYSPQLFWQTKGRGFRLNPQDPDKITWAITIAPRYLVDKRTGRLLQPEERPLCSAAFFDPEYYQEGIPLPQRQVTPPQNASISSQAVGHIKSTREVDEIVRKYQRKPWGFRGKPTTLAAYLSTIGRDRRLTFHRIQQALTKYRFREARAITGHLQDWEASTDDDTSTVGFNLGEDFAQLAFEDDINVDEEKALVATFRAGHESGDRDARWKSQLAGEKLLKAHMPVIYALASTLAARPADIDDLVQIASLEFYGKLHEYDPSIGKTRVVNFALPRLFRKLERAAWDLESPPNRTESASGFAIGRCLHARSVLEGHMAEALWREHEGDVGLETLATELAHATDLSLTPSSTTVGTYWKKVRAAGKKDQLEQSHYEHIRDLSSEEYLALMKEPIITIPGVAEVPRSDFVEAQKKISALPPLSEWAGTAAINGRDKELVAIRKAHKLTPLVFDHITNLSHREYIEALEGASEDTVTIPAPRHVSHKTLKEIRAQFMDLAYVPVRRLTQLLAELDPIADRDLDTFEADAKPADECIWQTQLNEALYEAVGTLRKHRQRILRNAFGLEGTEIELDEAGNLPSFRKVAVKMGITGTSVKSHVDDAIELLRDRRLQRTLRDLGRPKPTPTTRQSIDKWGYPVMIRLEPGQDPSDIPEDEKQRIEDYERLERLRGDITRYKRRIASNSRDVSDELRKEYRTRIATNRKKIAEILVRQPRFKQLADETDHKYEVDFGDDDEEEREPPRRPPAPEEPEETPRETDAYFTLISSIRDLVRQERGLDLIDTPREELQRHIETILDKHPELREDAEKQRNQFELEALRQNIATWEYQLERPRAKKEKLRQQIHEAYDRIEEILTAHPELRPTP